MTIFIIIVSILFAFLIYQTFLLLVQTIKIEDRLDRIKEDLDMEKDSD